jgi:hypothetical protein
MATATAKRGRAFGPEANGIRLTPGEFDRADFTEGWHYELINGVLIVSPIPSVKERDPNQELGHWLRNYQEAHSQGSALDFTIYDQIVKTRGNRTTTWSVSCWGGRRAFKRCSTAPGKASRKGKAYPRRPSGRPFGTERKHGRQRPAADPNVAADRARDYLRRVRRRSGASARSTYRTDLRPASRPSPPETGRQRPVLPQVLLRHAVAFAHGLRVATGFGDRPGRCSVNQ